MVEVLITIAQYCIAISAAVFVFAFVMGPVLPEWVVVPDWFLNRKKK